MTTTTIEANKEIVRRYFHDALDVGNVALLDELFHHDCTIYRTESIEPHRGIEAIRNVVRSSSTRYQSMKSDIKFMIAEDEKVACYLTHTATYRKYWQSRIGQHDLTGRLP